MSNLYLFFMGKKYANDLDMRFIISTFATLKKTPLY